MNEPESVFNAPPAPPAAAVASLPLVAKRRGGIVVWFFLILTAAVALHGYWRLRQIEQGRDASAQNELSAVQQQSERIAALQTAIDAARRDGDSLRARLEDTAKVNDSLRAQVLGLGERVRLAEDAVANLAEKRLSSHDALLANEAELLLVLGQERYALSADPAPALEAYRLADAALAQANDAAFATVRQTVQAETAALAALPVVDLPMLQVRLADLRVSLAQWPLARPAPERDVRASRWERVLDRFVRISRDEDWQARMAQNDPLLARALLDASLREAQTALLLRDPIRLKNAVHAAQAQIAHDFDAGTPGVAQAQALLGELAKADLVPPMPGVLGAAAKELRNLRATQAQPAPAKAEGKP